MSATEYDAGVSALREEWLAERRDGETAEAWIARTGRRFGAHGGKGASYLRPDGMEMVPIAPGVHVGRVAGERLGLVARRSVERAIEEHDLPNAGAAQIDGAPEQGVGSGTSRQRGGRRRGDTVTHARDATQVDAPPAPPTTPQGVAVAPGVRKTARALLALGASVGDVATSTGLALCAVREIVRDMRSGGR